MNDRALVVVKGGGDLATGVAYHLFRAGFRVLVTEVAQPLAVRRAVSFAQAVYSGEHVVDGVTARRACSVDEASTLQGVIPVLIDPQASSVHELRPHVLIDGIMAKANTGTRLCDAATVIALGPGFTAGIDCHAVIETSRGEAMGRVITCGSASADTAIPGEVGGETTRRVLRAPISGRLHALREIGDGVCPGDIVALVDGTPVESQIGGVLRGLLHDGVHVSAGTKLGDVDPRSQRELCFTMSDKSLAVGAGALEAVRCFLIRRRLAVEPRRSRD